MPTTVERGSPQCAPTQGGFRMVNKSLLMGVALGVGFATAGGVTAYQFLGGADRQGGTAMIEQDADQDVHAEHGSIQHDTHGSGATAAPASAAAVQPAPRPAAAPAPAPAPAPAAVREECYEETVANEPRDKRRIAGTAIGALVGGAVARDVGDRDLTTAVGAAVGAYAGNKIQQRIQERRADKATQVRCVPVQ